MRVVGKDVATLQARNVDPTNDDLDVKRCQGRKRVVVDTNPCTRKRAEALPISLCLEQFVSVQLGRLADSVRRSRLPAHVVKSSGQRCDDCLRAQQCRHPISGLVVGLVNIRQQHTLKPTRVHRIGASPVTPTRYVRPMTCVEIPEPVQRLLKALSESQEIPAALLDQDAVTLAAENGWVYEYSEMVGLTGADAYHAATGRGSLA